MSANIFKTKLIRTVLASSIFLLASGVALADSVVTLTAAPTTTTLPDGQTVPMWGYACGSVSGNGVSCTAANGTAQTGSAWQPPLITVPSGQALTITLKNNLSFATGSGSNTVPTSLVIVGQLGGGLGAAPARMPSPLHAAQGTTWPGTLGTTNPGDPVFTPPAQADRVRSFATEVAAGASANLVWKANNLRPGTYLIQSGTQPSIQGPMGLYGVLVVTDANYPGQAFDKDVTLLLSEIDPVQNAAVNTAVRTAGFSDTLVWNGQSGKCGDLSLHTCYPPAVNYDPRYYLINGVSFDRSNAAASALAVPANGAQGRVLLRFVNAGLRMHIPAVVGTNMTLLAEDGNKLPGVPKVQSEIFLAAGKTYDVTIRPKQSIAGTYDPATFAVFDRQLSLSTNNQRDGGMQTYISVAGGVAPAAVAAVARDDSYYLVGGNVLAVAEAAKGLMANDTGVYGVQLLSAPSGTGSTLRLNADGTFTYTPGAGVTSDSFSYCANGTVSGATCSSGATATVTLAACTGACLGGTPTAAADSYTSNIASLMRVGSPGVLANDTDPSGLLMKAGGLTNVSGGTVTLNPDGSFIAIPSAVPVGAGTSTVSFQYQAINAQNTSSALTTATVTFKGGSGIAFEVKDAKTGVKISDYRWIIEEDRTVWIDPNKESAAGAPPVRNVAINFHTSHMPVVAQGCVGSVSCETGQTLLGQPAVCDVGNGICRTDATARTPITPDQVHLDPLKRYYISILPGDGSNPIIEGAAVGAEGVGHAMGGAQIAAGQKAVDIYVQETPLETAKIAVFVFEDDSPLNGENDAGGGVDALAPNEPGLGGFSLVLLDQAGAMGDPAGQITFDMFGMPVSNALAGTINPATGNDACPISKSSDGVVGMIVTCPKYESDGKTMSALAGHALIANMYPGLYEVVASPGADRIARGEEWLQTNTLDGTKAIEVFIKAGEPGYFQEFGPGGFHVAMGFANPKVINDRKAAVCANQVCTATINGMVTGTRMSRTPDQRVYSSGSYDVYSFAQCYVSLGTPDGDDFAFAKCAPDGSFTFTGIPKGNMKVTVFDQWNDLLVDGLSTPIKVDGEQIGTAAAPLQIPVTQWRTNLYGRVFLDQNGDGVSQENEPGLPLVPYNIRFRDGSYAGFNNTDMAGYAGFNEVFPFLNWLVVDIDSARYKLSGVHVVYDAGGPVDGTTGAANSDIAHHIANTTESPTAHLPAELRVPGARYCEDADCTGTGSFDPASGKVGSTGRVDPGWVTSEGWQGLLGQNSFIEFAMKPFVPGENGGIKGHVLYTPTRPFDDPALLLQLSWAAGVPNVKVNLYQEGTAADGTKTLKLVDSTTSSSWDDWAQGFRKNPDGSLVLGPDGKAIPNMNCPGQETNSPFYFTMKNGTQALNPTTEISADGRFKCYDGWSMLNQVQPAPYNGMYKFPSIVARNPVTGVPTGSGSLNGISAPIAGSNCTICVANPDDGTPMLPAGKYVVEVVVPEGYELVKEEDKNILLGDAYIAPVTQQFGGIGNIFILPDQAAMNAFYNPVNAIQATTNNGAVPRREGDTGSIEVFWPCVGAMRIVPDLNSLYPGAGQAAPFAGASRPLCDRKEVTLGDQMTVLAKFYVFSSTHIASHFTGAITNDFASEFDPFSPQFGEKFGVPNVPVGIRNAAGKEIARVYADQWGIYNGVNFSSYTVNPPSPSGYVPQMMIACMNDPGPIPGPDGAMITDPAYNPAYSNFCYEIPFMPGQTSYLDTPVVPTMSFAAGYNLPDCEYPDTTPAIKSVEGSLITTSLVTGRGPWVASTSPVASVTMNNRGSYTTVPTVSFTSTDGNGGGAAGTANLGVGSVTITDSGQGSYTSSTPTVTVTFASPPCTINGSTCVRATGSVTMTTSGSGGTTNTRRRVQTVNIITSGSGYTSPPAITFSRGSATATGTLRVNSVSVTSAGSGYDAAPTVAFSSGTATAIAVLGAPVASDTITITALGDKKVLNHAYSGPQATTAPFNQKFITRHYGFGSCTLNNGECSNGSRVTIGGVNAPVTAWSDSSITVRVPSGVPNCAMQQRNAPEAQCGQLEITVDNGKKSVDTVTVTIGGKTPAYVNAASPSVSTFGHIQPNPLQTAIDQATPGDLIIVGPGTYKENLLMWKPVRLQGVAAESVIINADAHPAGKLEAWRRQVNCLFGLALNGRPNTGTFDTVGTGYTCPDEMRQHVDRIPFESILGWDVTGNGNLAQMMQEPTLMGAYEGAGVTVLGKGVWMSAGTSVPDQFGAATAGGFPTDYRYLAASDCGSNASSFWREYTTTNFLCNPSRIDGMSVINSSQGGGAIFAHAWNHNLEVSNTRVHGNHGTLTGGITIGNGEFADPFVCDAAALDGTTPLPFPGCTGATLNMQLGYGFNKGVYVHHNAVTGNASIGDALYSFTPSAAGGVTFCTGSDSYRFNYNWVCGNLSTGDGGGMVHSGFSNNGTIAHNWILFNQSASATLPTNGGGIGVLGASPDRTLASTGQECGTTSDVDCPPGLPEGTGRNLLIDANLIIGNSAESGTGGGLRLQMVNGQDVIALPTRPEQWNDVKVTNNIITNNVAGWDGGGISLQDALKVMLINNTVMSNDSTASAGVLFNTLGAPMAATPPPGCTPTTDPTLPQNPNCNNPVKTSENQAAGVVTMRHTPNLVAEMPANEAGTQVRCPSGYGYGSSSSVLNDGSCREVSLPLLSNNVLWQNRAFHVEVGGFGSGQQGQQKVATLVPTLNQTSTGMCATLGTDVGAPGSAGPVNYWDIGVRGDTGPANHGSGYRLTPSYSILTGGDYSGNNNLLGSDPVVVRQYCNGARIPPEGCSGVSAGESAKCRGYNAPPGRSEFTGLPVVFALNQVTVAATVDEGNNWINLGYGPLALNNSALYTAPGAALMPLGDYSITTNSPAKDLASSSAAPDHDFFGRSRPQGGKYDIGAVEFGVASVVFSLQSSSGLTIVQAPGN